jgi:hypothetical protein
MSWPPRITIVANRRSRPCNLCPTIQDPCFSDFTGRYCHRCFSQLSFDERLWRRLAIAAKRRIVRQLRRANVYAEWGDESRNEIHYTVKSARRSARLAH